MVATWPERRSILRITWLPMSATYTSFSSCESATPVGAMKRASLPTPSSAPSCGTSCHAPATVVTEPSERRTCRIASFCVSATNTNSGDAARPVGPAKAALVPTASSWSNSPLPASVETSKGGTSVTFRIRLPPVSATTRASGSEPGTSATPCGRLKVAKLPSPSVLPALPVPAIVVTFPSERCTCTILLPSSSAMYSESPSADAATCVGLTSAAPSNSRVSTNVCTPLDA
mmetsp:Transcript_39892/g.98678  ORF Transcript_39892/g.98678 Transcript_39892/m.98678 type:complete len:231 (+) Transcript_39892:539-1231(+)